MEDNLTSSVCISQLFADHSCISAVPGVITHCPPLVIDAHLHSTLILIGASHQTNSTIGTVSSDIDYSECVHEITYMKKNTTKDKGLKKVGDLISTIGKNRIIFISLQKRICYQNCNC